MTGRKISRAAIAGALVLAGTAGVPAAARADDDVIETRFRACTPDAPVIAGVTPCNKAWKLRSGEVELERDGELEVELKGLVLNDNAAGDAHGTPGGVTHVIVSLVCGGQVAAESERAALGKSGNASLETRLSMPARCLAPALLVRDATEGKPGPWLAVTGY